MSKFVNINHTRPEFTFVDSKCIGRRCFHPVLDGNGLHGCNNKKHRGCPDPLPEYDKAAADRRKVEGWRLSR